MARTLYTGLEELDDPVVVAAVMVVGFGLWVGNNRTVDGCMESIRLRLVGDCGFVGSLVVGVVVAGRTVRSRLPWLEVIGETRPGCTRGAR